MQVGWNNRYIAEGGSMLAACEHPQVSEPEKALLERRVNKRVEKALKEAITFTDESSTRGLTPTGIARDLSQDQQTRVYEQSYYAYKTNPFATASIEIMTDFVVGEGFTYEAEGKLKDELDLFWNNPANNWNVRQENKVRELGLYGNQFYTVAKNEFTNRVELGYLDPARVIDVEFLDGNTEVVDKIFVKAPNIGDDPIPMKVIRENPETGKLEGEVFYFSVNRVSNAKFGTSDLLASLEWMDIYDQYLFAAAERSLLQESYVWHYQWSGLDEPDLKKKQQQYRNPPKPGSSRHTNDRVKINAVGPTPGTNSNTKVMADLIKFYSIVANRYPEHWFTEGGDVNFATAKAQGTPIFKRLQRRQNLWVEIINYIFRYVAEQLLDADLISQTEFDSGWKVIASEIVSEDTDTAATSFKTVADSLAIAEVSGWITKDQASDAFTSTATKFGFMIATPAQAQTAPGSDDEEETEPPPPEDQEFAEALRRSRVPYLAELERRAS